jgi:hypothetical protein
MSKGNAVLLPFPSGDLSQVKLRHAYRQLKVTPVLAVLLANEYGGKARRSAATADVHEATTTPE